MLKQRQGNLKMVSTGASSATGTIKHVVKDDDKLGSNCSGSDGTANRTLTLADTTAGDNGLTVTVNGTTLHEGAGKDFTISSGVITFLNVIDNSDNIRVVYFI